MTVPTPLRPPPWRPFSFGVQVAEVPDARYLVTVMASTKKTTSKVRKQGGVKRAAKVAGANGKRGAAAKTTVRRYGRRGEGKGGAGKSLALGAPDAPPVRQRIEDPVQRILARYIPSLCAIFGFPAARLTVRGASKDPVEMVQNSLREVTLGSVVWLGRELGLHWSGLHNRQSKAERGRTEIPELLGAHRFSLGMFATRFGALTGLADDPATGEARKPVGQVGAFVRQAYELVRADAMRDVGEAVPL